MSTGGTGSPGGGGTPSGMKRLSCQVQLDANSIAVAPSTATARNQRLGDTALPMNARLSASVTIIVPWVSEPAHPIGRPAQRRSPALAWIFISYQ
ncbi:hypothetical protein MSHI_02220 [Mycobacterium shinjukuense]|uniref:Uncharacterized protein n=1 Tax=Mycobacterium shinjukuense TaxID=398694 RepID=A0A7I7MJI5_9MYCO|nr:hypothetical protein MSHI_02220 [Mycobacterium shinjukuense]